MEKSALKLDLADYKRILFEGDSKTDRNKTRWPFLRMMNWDLSWADIFEETIFCWKPCMDITFSNIAVSGSNIDKMTARLDKLKEFGPDLVMFTAGNNDWAQGIDVEQFEEKMRAYVSEVNGIGAKILMLGGFKIQMPLREVAEPALVEKTEHKVPYYAVMKKIAEETGNFYLNVNPGMEKSCDALYAKHPLHTIYSDGAHLNELGARVLCGEVLKVFDVISD